MSIMRHGVRTRQRNGGKVEFFSGLIKIYHLKKCSQRKFVCLWNAVTANRQKVAKEFLRRVLFVNSYEPVETFTMQAAYFLYCTVNYFLQRMSHLFLIGLMSTKEVILWNALLSLYYVTKGLDLMAIINLWKNFMYLNY